MENWKTHTSDVQKEVGGDLVEIMEECDEEQEKLWRGMERRLLLNYFFLQCIIIIFSISYHI